MSQTKRISGSIGEEGDEVGGSFDDFLSPPSEDTIDHCVDSCYREVKDTIYDVGSIVWQMQQ